MAKYWKKLPTASPLKRTSACSFCRVETAFRRWRPVWNIPCTSAGITDVCLLLVDENLIRVYAGILFRFDFLHGLHQFYEFRGKIAGDIRHSIICRCIRWLCIRVPWVLHELCSEQRLVNFLLHFFAGNALVDLFFCASAEFPILTVDKDSQKRVRYFFRTAHVELLTDEKCLAGFGLLFADQKVAGFACF